MARQFTTAILLPANPAAPLQATTKQYVDAADGLKQSSSEKGAASGYASLNGSGQVPIAQLPIADPIAHGTGISPSVHTHSTVDAEVTLGGNSVVGIATAYGSRLPGDATATAQFPKNTITYAATLSVPAYTAANISAINYIVLTGNLVLSIPANVQCQIMRFRFLGSGAARTVTFGATPPMRAYTGLPTSIVVPSGKFCDIVMMYDYDDNPSAGAWTLQAVGIQA